MKINTGSSALNPKTMLPTMHKPATTSRMTEQKQDGDINDKPALSLEHTLSLNYSCAHLRDKVHMVLELRPVDLRSDQTEDIPPGPVIRTVCVIDASTSMLEPHGPGGHVSKLDKIKMFAQLLIETTCEDDYAGVVTFGTHAKVIVPLSQMDAENKELAMAAIENIETTGVTNISDGIFTALNQFRNSLFRRNKIFNDNIILFTDGMANEGILDVNELIAEIRHRVKLVRDDSLYERDYSVRICTCGTRGFMPEFIYYLGKTFSSDPIYLLSDDSSIELNLIKPVLLRRAEIASHIQVEVTALNGVTLEKAEMPQEYTAGLPEAQDWMDPFKASYYIQDITADIPRNLVIVMNLPKKSKRHMKKKNVLNVEVLYKGRDRKRRKLTLVVPYLTVPRKETKNTEPNVLEIARHDCRLCSLKSLVAASEYMRRLDRSSARDALHDGANSIRDICDQMESRLSEEMHSILVQYSDPLLCNFQFFDHLLGDFTVRWDDAWGMLIALVSSLSRESPTAPEVFVEGTELYGSVELDEYLDILYSALEEMYRQKGFPEIAIGKYKSAVVEEPVPTHSTSLLPEEETSEESQQGTISKKSTMESFSSNKETPEEPTVDSQTNGNDLASSKTNQNGLLEAGSRNGLLQSNL